MAVVDQNLVSIPSPGMSVASLDAGAKGSLYIQNLRHQGGRWGTRGGFGLYNACKPIGLFPTETTETLACHYYRQPSTDREYMVMIGQEETWTSNLSVAKESQFQYVYWLSVLDIQSQARQSGIFAKRVTSTSTPLYDAFPMIGQGGQAEQPGPIGFSSSVLWSINRYQPVQVIKPHSAFSFAQIGDFLFVCHPDLGVWAINPFIASENIGQDSVSGRDTYSGQAESAWFFPLVPRPSLDSTIVTFSQSDFPQARTICVWQSRLVVASERSLIFSDPDDPGVFAAYNQVAVPSNADILALAPVRNGIMILTDSETWLYIPSSDYLASGGSITLISATTGIVQSGQRALSIVKDSVFWVSTRGVHAYSGGSDVTDIMPSVSQLWAQTLSTGVVPNPQNQYFSNTGTPSLLGQTDPIQSLSLDDVVVQWEPRTEELYISMPSINRVLVYAPENGTPNVGWWVTTTQCVNSSTQVATETTIESPRVLGVQYGRGTWCVDRKSNVYLLQRGGQLDVSSHPSEDKIQNSAPRRWYIQNPGPFFPTPGNPFTAWWVGPAYRLPRGFETVNQQPLEDIWEFRIWASIPDQLMTQPDLFNHFRFHFVIDGSYWKFLTVGSSNTLDLTFGPDIQSILPGFTDLGAYDIFGTPDPNGVQGQIEWNLPGSPLWGSYPDPGLYPYQWNEICRVRIKRLNPQLSDVDPVERAVIQIRIAETGAGTNLYDGSVWMAGAYDRQGQAAFGRDNKIKPVDWVYHTPLVGDGDTTFKVRGFWVRSRRSGQATSVIRPSYPFGPYNWMYASNDRDLSATEYVEPYQPIGVDQSQTTDIFPTVYQSPEPQQQLFGSALSTYGSVSGTPKGTVLTGQTPVTQWSLPSGGRGETARWLLYGFLRNRAEYIQLADGEPFKAIIRPLSKRKRRGGQIG